MHPIHWPQLELNSDLKWPNASCTFPTFIRKSKVTSVHFLIGARRMSACTAESVVTNNGNSIEIASFSQLIFVSLHYSDWFVVAAAGSGAAPDCTT